MNMTRHCTIIAAAAWLTALPAGAAETTLKFVERATTNVTSVHAGKAADNAGDVLTFTNPVFDAANTGKVGSDQGYCVRLIPGKVYECHWTLLVPQGQIVVDGPFLDDSDSVLAVIGGTGKYSGIRGEMGLHARDAQGSAYDFTYKLK